VGGFELESLMAASAPRSPWYRILYIQVLIAVAVGIAVGYFFPDQGKALKPLGDGFVKLIKMMIAPIIFCTVVHGVASIGDLKKLGRIGGKTLLYFEIVSTLALAIGLLVVNVLKPGAGFHVNPADLGAKAAQTARVFRVAFTEVSFGLSSGHSNGHGVEKNVFSMQRKVVKM
jgi:aerobic C4-dicarboxylate transport protein